LALARLQPLKADRRPSLNPRVARGTPGILPAPIKLDVTSSQLPSDTGIFGAGTASRGASAGGGTVQPWITDAPSAAAMSKPPLRRLLNIFISPFYREVRAGER